MNNPFKMRKIRDDLIYQMFGSDEAEKIKNLMSAKEK